LSLEELLHISRQLSFKRRLHGLAFSRGISRAFKLAKAFVKISNALVKTRHLLCERVDERRALSGMSNKGGNLWGGMPRWSKS